MPEISKSPKRNTFQQERYLARKAEEGETPSEHYIEMFESFRNQKEKQESDPEWQKNNLEYDLRSTDWILEKVRNMPKISMQHCATTISNA